MANKLYLVIKSRFQILVVAKDREEALGIADLGDDSVVKKWDSRLSFYTHHGVKFKPKEYLMDYGVKGHYVGDVFVSDDWIEKMKDG